MKALRFDGFSLDLGRGTLCIGDREIFLRPKTFGVLQFLADNAGRLISKEQLLAAVWPDVAVTDDSLVQCIRELRDKLHDEEHRLIRTVSRRGYLLDAVVVTAEPGPPFARSIVESAARSSDDASGSGAAQRVLRAMTARRAWAVAGLLCIALAAAYLSGRSPLLIAQHLVASRNAPAVFKDCDACPEMVALPAGGFTMGSPDSEAGREGQEGPPRRVVLTKPVAIGKFEVTIDQFTAFVAETGYEAGDSCHAYVFDARPSEWPLVKGSFRAPGFRVTGMHPAVCVNWDDAKAYTKWLAGKTGRPYRLPTEAEWDYAARDGKPVELINNADAKTLCTFAHASLSVVAGAAACSEHPARGTLEVGRLKPNPVGLFDMAGNVWEWAETCFSDHSTPKSTGDPCDRVLRGGSWHSGIDELKIAARKRAPVALSGRTIGFRVARDVD